jgi:ribonuclease VapC
LIIDSSAVIAMVLDERDAEALFETLAAATAPSMATPTYVEATVVARGRSIADLDAFLRRARVRLVDFTPEMAQVATDAYRRFGKGSGSPARLNLGDTYSYALAKVTGEPLLFVGDDFTHTDITPALTR